MTRAPIKLSREMKLLLLLLLMVALIGAWYVWTNSRAANALPDQGSAPSSAGSAEATADAANPEAGGSAADAALPGTDSGLAADRPATGTVPVASGSDAADPGGAGTVGALAVQPNRPVEIEVIPPFPTPEVSDAVSADSTTPGGINPEASIAAIPSNNPFRPLTLDESAQTTASTPITSASTPITPDRAPLPSSSGNQNSDVQIIPITPSSAGPLAISPIPGAGGSTSASSGSLSSLPAIPGGDGSTSLGSPSSPGDTGSGATVSGSTPDRTIAGTSGDAGVTVIGSTAGTMGSGTAASRTPSAAGSPARTTPQGNVVITAPKPPKPIAPPIAGMNVPSVTRVPAAASKPAAPTTGAQSASGAVTANGTATSRPVPGTPQVITALGQDAAAQDTAEAVPAATPVASQLEQFVQKRQLAFNAAVLGPINTAIFRGQDGYVVVAVGQTLPDSQVTVKEVSATGAVLSLGNDLKTLELDQR